MPEQFKTTTIPNVTGFWKTDHVVTHEINKISMLMFMQVHVLPEDFLYIMVVEAIIM